MYMSKAEREFRADYPNARVETRGGTCGDTYCVYAGDYLCSESYSRVNAFRSARDCAKAGLITPDPNETATAQQ